MTMTLHPTDIHFCGIRIWFEHEGVAPHLGEDLRMARESLAHMAENACMLLPGLKTPRVKGYQDRIAALEHDLARANREWNAWQEMAKKAEAELARSKEAHGTACGLVARMHAAAVGEIRGPSRGVVEDIEDLRCRAERAETAYAAACEERNQAQAFAKEAQAPPLLAELLDILQAVVADHGASEGAADCARRIIKERNEAKATVKKLVDRRIDGIPGPPWPTDLISEVQKLHVEIAGLKEQARQEAIGFKIALDMLRAERDEARQMHRERVFWEKAALNEQITNLGERLTTLRDVVKRVRDRVAAEQNHDMMRSEREALTRYTIDELRKALG